MSHCLTIAAVKLGRIPKILGFGDIPKACAQSHAADAHRPNVVITSGDGEIAEVLSKGLAVRADGSCGTVVYHDELRRGEAGWRIARRRVSPRRAPLRP